MTLNFSASQQKSSDGVVITAFYRSMGKFWGRKIFWKFSVFWLILDCLKKILNPRQIYALRLSSMHSTCENERFGHEIPLGNFVSTSVHPDFERKNVLAINKFQHVCQNFFLPVQSTILGNKFYTEKKIVLQIVSDFEQNCFWRVVEKLAAEWWEKHFSSRVVFSGNKYVLKIYEFLTVFKISENKSVGAMKICILTVLGINLGEKRWLGIALFLNVFRHWAKTFRPGSNMFMARKWKFHSTCGEVHFRGTHFQKNVSSTFFPEFEQK